MFPEARKIHHKSIGFRVLDVTQSTVLVYCLKKSDTWTLPGIKTTSKHSIINGLFSLSKSLEAELKSAVCILNVKETVPLYLSNNVETTDVLFQYTIYDVILQFNYQVVPWTTMYSSKLPDNVKAGYFMTIKEINNLSYKTPLLNHLITVFHS